MNIFFGILTALFFSGTVSATPTTHIQCYVADDYQELEDGSYRPLNLTPHFSIEAASDHIMVKMRQDGATDKLYPYKIRSQWLRRTDRDGNFVNYDIWGVEPDFSDRFAFAPEARKTEVVSDSYNQYHVLWGKDSEILSAEIDGKEVELYLFSYYYPTIERYRVVGDSYFCPLTSIKKLFEGFASTGSLTIYE